MQGRCVANMLMQSMLGLGALTSASMHVTNMLMRPLQISGAAEALTTHESVLQQGVYVNAMTVVTDVTHVMSRDASHWRRNPTQKGLRKQA